MVARGKLNDDTVSKEAGANGFNIKVIAVRSEDGHAVKADTLDGDTVGLGEEHTSNEKLRPGKGRLVFDSARPAVVREVVNNIEFSKGTIDNRGGA